MGRKKKYQHGISKEVSFLALWGMDTHTLTQGISYSYVFSNLTYVYSYQESKFFNNPLKKNYTSLDYDNDDIK